MSHWANMLFTQRPLKADIKYPVMRQLCPLTVRIIFNMSDKMNPLWKYFILDFLQKMPSTSNYIPSNPFHTASGRIGRVVAIHHQIKVEGRSDFIGVLVALPGQCKEASFWIKSYPSNQLPVAAMRKAGRSSLHPGDETKEHIIVSPDLLLTEVKIQKSINDWLFSH